MQDFTFPNCPKKPIFRITTLGKFFVPELINSNCASHMYGVVLLCLKDYVVRKHGAKRWKEICTNSGILHDAFVVNQSYTDSLFDDLLGAIAQNINVPIPSLLETVGSWFIDYVRDMEYGRLLSISSNNFTAALLQLNTMNSKLRGYTMPDCHASAEADCKIRLRVSPGN